MPISESYNPEPLTCEADKEFCGTTQNSKLDRIKKLIELREEITEKIFRTTKEIYTFNN